MWKAIDTATVWSEDGRDGSLYADRIAAALSPARAAAPPGRRGPVHLVLRPVGQEALGVPGLRPRARRLDEARRAGRPLNRGRGPAVAGAAVVW